MKKRGHSLTGRLVIINTFTFISSFFIVATISSFTLWKIITDRQRSTMAQATEAVLIDAEREISEMLSVSQQMTESGGIGQYFIETLESDNDYERYMAQRNFEKTYTTTLFATSIGAATYIDTVTGRNYLGNINQLDNDFSLGGLSSILFETSEIQCRGIYDSKSKYDNHPVFSVVRKGNFLQDSNITVYTEVKTDMLDTLERLRKEGSSRYDLVILDSDGEITYSTNKELCLFHDEIISEHCGKLSSFEGFKYYFLSSRYGYYVGIFIPKREFYSGINGYTILIIGALLLSFLFLALSIFLTRKLIIRKLDIVKHNIQEVGEGHIKEVTGRTGIIEYDNIIDQFNQMLIRIGELIKEIQKTEREKWEVSQELLYYQINPHFLLNSLNSVYWMVKTGKLNEATRYISKLTLVLKYMLGKNTQPRTLRTELEMLKAFIELEQQRYDFNYKMNVQEGDYLCGEIPKLMIQPIVENSIQHGLRENGNLIVQVNCEDDNVIIEIFDDGIGMTPEEIDGIYDNIINPDHHRGLGLRYVKTVMEQDYGDNAKLVIQSEKGKYTKVILMFPKTAGETHD